MKYKLPVIAQVNYPATLQAVRSVREAQEDGASATCCAVPRMFTLDDGALFKHFDRILQAIDIPLIIQDFNPGGATVSVRFVAQLHRAHPHFRYVKLEEPLMAQKVEAILQETSGAVGALEGWGSMFMLELIPAGICGVMPGLGISDILARVFRLAKQGDSDHAYELFQGVLPQIVFGLQNLELYHHAEKLLLEARGITSRSTVRQASRTLSEDDAKHIQFLNSRILDLSDHLGFPRDSAGENDHASREHNQKGFRHLIQPNSNRRRLVTNAKARDKAPRQTRFDRNLFSGRPDGRLVVRQRSRALGLAHGRGRKGFDRG